MASEEPINMNGSGFETKWEEADGKDDIINIISLLKNHDAKESVDNLSRITLDRMGLLLSERQDVIDNIVSAWISKSENDECVSFLVWALSVHSYMIHEYPTHIQRSILRALASNFTLSDQKMKQLFLNPHTTRNMIDYCKKLYSNITPPVWFVNLKNSIGMIARLNVCLVKLYHFTVSYQRLTDEESIINALLMFGEHDLALGKLEGFIQSIGDKFPLDVAYCHLWYCSIILDKQQFHKPDLQRPALRELAQFQSEVVFKENGLLRKTETRVKKIEIPKQLFHLYEDAPYTLDFCITEHMVPIEQIGIIADRLNQASMLFHKAGYLKMSFQIYDRLLEYYQRTPNSEKVLGNLHKEYSLWYEEKNQGAEILSKYFRYYFVSVTNSEADFTTEEYIYRIYSFENIDSVVESRLRKDFPHHTVGIARNAQISKQSIRILPALEERSGYFIVYDYLRQEDQVYAEDDAIFGCSKRRCLVEDTEVLNQSGETNSLMILRGRVISSVAVFDEVNQMDANCHYFGKIQNQIKQVSQTLAENIIGGVPVKTSSVCFKLFVFIGNLLYDLVEGTRLDYILGFNQCKQLVYCYRAIYRDELADRKKDIRRRWLKEKKTALETNSEVPPEPSLSNLIEHNGEFVKLKEMITSLLETSNNSFVLFKELAEKVYQNHDGVIPALERLQLVRLQTLSMLSDLTATMEDLPTEHL